jgi:hypothetical protein
VIRVPRVWDFDMLLDPEYSPPRFRSAPATAHRNYSSH